MTDYETLRQERISKNKALLKGLAVQSGQVFSQPKRSSAAPPAKRQKLARPEPRPTRSSARIAAAPLLSLNEDALAADDLDDRPRKRVKGVVKRTPKVKNEDGQDNAETESSRVPSKDIETLRAGWTDWKSEATEPSRNATDGTLQFESHPDFTPNKTPEEMLREGCFGGSYFRSLYSRALGTTISDDWRELPESWYTNPPLNVDRYVTSPTYDPEVNKYKVSCGQSIEEWEAAGWINHTYDVRGWFQWYCRFYMGRRCPDDARQISRWRKCVGETGRWRRMLLKKYVTMGVRSVSDEGDDDMDEVVDGDDGEGRAKEVSPVMHQTCQHWAFEIRQPVLDEYWRNVGR